MNEWRLRCGCCGRFISDEDYKSDKTSDEAIWNWDRTEVENVKHFCVKCTETKRITNASNDRLRNAGH